MKDEVIFQHGGRVGSSMTDRSVSGDPGTVGSLPDMPPTSTLPLLTQFEFLFLFVFPSERVSEPHLALGERALEGWAVHFCSP